MFDFQKLEVYNKAKTFNKVTLELLKRNNFDRVTNDQLRRASFSIMLNIAGGRHIIGCCKTGYITVQHIYFQEHPNRIFFDHRHQSQTFEKQFPGQSSIS